MNRKEIKYLPMHIELLKSEPLISKLLEGKVSYSLHAENDDDTYYECYTDEDTADLMVRYASHWKTLLKESRDLLVMCTLIDKSNQCKEMVDKIDKAFNKDV